MYTDDVETQSVCTSAAASEGAPTPPESCASDTDSVGIVSEGDEEGWVSDEASTGKVVKMFLTKRKKRDPKYNSLRFTASKVVPPDSAKSSSYKKTLQPLSEQMKDRDFRVAAATEDGFHQLVPSKPFKPDSRYTDLYCDSTLAKAIRTSQQPSRGKEWAVEGRIRAHRRPVGQESGETLHIAYNGLAKDQGCDSWTFKTSIVESANGPDDNVELVQFFKDRMLGRTCSLTVSQGNEHIYDLTVLDPPVGAKQEVTKFETDLRFAADIAGRGHKFPTGSVHSKVWSKRRKARTPEGARGKQASTGKEALAEEAITEEAVAEQCSQQ